MSFQSFDIMINDEQQEELFDNYKDLSGYQAAAVMLITLGVEKASKLLKVMNEKEVEEITKAVAQVKNVSPEVVERVIDEFYQIMVEKNILLDGGEDVAKKLLVMAKGQSEADTFFKKMEAEKIKDAFSSIQNSDTDKLVMLIKKEHPQVSAVVLSRLNQATSAEILSKIPEELRTDIALRLAKLGFVADDIFDELTMALQEQLSGDFKMPEQEKSGAAVVADILDESDISTERQILASIEAADPELATQIKELMFLFEDIIKLDDRAMQVAITKFDKQDMVMGLKGVAEELKDKFLNNMSSRAKEMFLEDYEVVGPVHKKQVEEAQQNIVHTIKALDMEGKISIKAKNMEQMIE